MTPEEKAAVIAKIRQDAMEVMRGVSRDTLDETVAILEEYQRDPEMSRESVDFNAGYRRALTLVSACRKALP